MNIEATKQVSQSETYELKVPYVITDDYGNEMTQYRKEVVTRTGLNAIKANLQSQLDAINSKLSACDAADNA